MKHNTCPTCLGSGSVSDDFYQRTLFDAPGQVGAKHPSTSVRAATVPRFGSQRYQVLELLDTFGPMTAFELSHRMGKSPNQVATRCGELREQLFVRYYREDGQVVERPTTPGNTGRVQQITLAGKRAIAEGLRR